MAKVELSNALYFRLVVRMFQTNRLVDRMMLVIASKLPYGSFSRVVTQMEQGGFIRRKRGVRNSYDVVELKESNPDLAGIRLNYGHSRISRPQVYETTMLFDTEFLPAWTAFLKEFPVDRRTPDRRQLKLQL